jgi:signal transduction histidine kinase
VTLRTKFLLALLLGSIGLTTASLVIVRRIVTRQIRAQIVQDLQNSIATFENVKREREDNLNHSAALMADLPIVRALMSTQHQATIQDASAELWRTSGSDLLVLSDTAGNVLAVQSAAPKVTSSEAQKELSSSLGLDGSVDWWLCGKRLFEVAIRPIYLGDAKLNYLVGFVALGSEIDDKVAHELSQVAASEVVFRSGGSLVRGTLAPNQDETLATKYFNLSKVSGPSEIILGDEKFLAKEIQLSEAPASVHLTVLKSLDQSQSFLKHLDRLLLELGLVALVLGAALVWIIARGITRPLQSLVLGVRALGKSDFDYPLQLHSGNDEVAELTTAFGRMRAELQQSQRELVESERLATIGRMASSISHDLRHHLSAVVSNAEFMTDSRRGSEREELYGEIRLAVNQMTDLVDSLMEFSRTRESLRLSRAHPEDAIEAAIRAIRLRPEFREIGIEVSSIGIAEGAYDVKRLERVFHNLLLNACEAVDLRSGRVSVEVCAVADHAEIRIRDNGRGIPDSFKTKVFDPFFTEGKANGTGLGLTVAQKIVEDHGGSLRLESSSASGTVFLVLLPCAAKDEKSELLRRGDTVRAVQH